MQGIYRKTSRTLADAMIKYQNSKQISIEDFTLPFSGKLSEKNRWVILAKLLPWDELVSGYIEKMDIGFGRPGIDPRVTVGALIIKHKKALSDEETVEDIKENPYLQYFLSFSGYHYEQAFTPSLFVEIRERLGHRAFNEMTQGLTGTSCSA